MRNLLSALLIAGALSLTGCEFDSVEWGDSDRYKEEFSYDYKLAPGGRVFLENFNGSVEVLGWEKDAVQVTGTKYASREEVMKRVKIEVVSEPSSIRIRTIRPMETSCNCGARYVLRVPSKAVLDRIESSNGSIRAEGFETGPTRLKTSNGSIRTWNLKGDLEATTSNSSIEVGSFKGSAILKTSNGRIKAEGVEGNFDATTSNSSIDASVTQLEAGKPLKLRSSNGSINLALDKWNNNEISATTSNSSVNLRLPAGINAEIKARTSNGSITSDFEVTTRELSKTVLDGKLGSGGPLIDIGTSNGSIRLMKR
jgi:hypothetical protein